MVNLLKITFKGHIVIILSLFLFLIFSCEQVLWKLNNWHHLGPKTPLRKRFSLQYVYVLACVYVFTHVFVYVYINKTKHDKKLQLTNFRAGGMILLVCSVAQSCLTLCNQSHGLQHARLPCPSPYHQFELAQTHVHWTSDTI